MKKVYTINYELSPGDEVFIDGKMVKLTQEFIDENPDIFIPVPTKETGYVKCLAWDGDSHEVGVIYPVCNGVVLSREGVPHGFPTILESFLSQFEESNEIDFIKQEMFGRKVKSEPVPEYIMIKKDVEQGTGRWAAREPGKIYEVLKFDYWNGKSKKLYYVSENTCIVPEDCVPCEKKDFDLQELVEYCKSKYKVGDVVRKPGKGVISKITTMDFAYEPDGFSIWVKGEENNVKLYSKTHGWAVILQPLCTSKDGKNLYEGDRFYLVTDSFDVANIVVDNLSIKMEGQKFSTLELAENWALLNKPKDLADYENMMLLNDDEVKEDFNANVWEMYYWLKKNERKLYWSKVLQLIAEDLNTGWIPNWEDTKQSKFKIQEFANNFEIGANCLYNDGTIYFKSRDIADKAAKLLGDKLKIVYNV